MESAWQRDNAPFPPRFRQKLAQKKGGAAYQCPAPVPRAMRYCAKR